jgi:hypothetical protein
MSVSKCILFFFTCSIKMSRSEKILRRRQFMAARSSFQRLRHFYEAGFRHLISYSIWGLWEKNGGNVGSYIRCVFPWERCVCRRWVSAVFLRSYASGNQQKGSLRWKICTPATWPVIQRPGKTAHISQTSILVHRNTKEFHISTWHNLKV